MMLIESVAGRGDGLHRPLPCRADNASRPSASTPVTTRRAKRVVVLMARI